MIVKNFSDGAMIVSDDYVGRYDINRNVWEWGYWFNNTRFVVVFETDGE